MQITLYVAAMLALAAVPAQAQMGMWVTCDFQREGELHSDHLGVFAEGQGELVTNGFDVGWSREVLVTPVGETLFVFEEVDAPEQYRWVWSINLETMQGLAFSESYPVRSATCRSGAE